MDSYFENRGQKWSTQNTNIVTGDMDSPRRELSVRGLGFLLAVLVFLRIVFFCVRLLSVQSSLLSVWDKMISK